MVCWYTDLLDSTTNHCLNRWLSVTVGDCRWLSVTVSDCRWLSVTVGDCQWLSTTVGICQGQYVDDTISSTVVMVTNRDTTIHTNNFALSAAACRWFHLKWLYNNAEIPDCQWQCDNGLFESIYEEDIPKHKELSVAVWQCTDTYV